MSPADRNHRVVEVTLYGQFKDISFPLRCSNTARDNRVHGWVRVSTEDLGSGDNSATIHLEGLGYQVEGFLEWLRGGVPGVQIARMTTAPATPESWTSFQILD